MDDLPLRSYTSLRSWSRPSGGRHGVYENKEPTKPLSKLDSARLKLSKFKLKYGKQEKQEDTDSSLSLASEERLSEILTPLNNVQLMVEDPPDVEERSPRGSTNSSGEITDDSLMDDLKEEGPEKTLINRRLSPVNIPAQSVNFGQQRLLHKSPSESSLSEISENVHSFSSLIKSETKDDSIHATEKGKITIPVPRVEIVSVLERPDTETSRLSSVSSITSEPHSGQEIVQMASLLASPEVPVLVPAVPHGTEVHATHRNEASLHRSQDAIPETRVSSSTVDSVSSKLENSKETSSASSFADKYSSSDKISSPTFVPGKKEPREKRNAKVQTDTKRSRQVQVDLSWTETETEYQRRSCPVLRASSLPPGLRLTVTDDPLDECLDTIGVEDAVQVLLKSQLRLTLGLLQREQSLYINSCSAAARLEKGYRQHTLSDTRKFIRREKGLRGKLRRDAKLEKEGTALLRKQ